MNTNITKEKLVFFTIIIFAVLLGYNVIYKGKLNEIRQLKSGIKKEKEKNSILDSIGLLNNKLRLYQQRSFSTTEITGLVDKVSQLAAEAEVTIENFNPSQKQSLQAYVELPLVMSFECEYHKLGKLLSFIESNQEFIWVKGLKMHKTGLSSSGREASRVPQITLTVSGLYLEDYTD
jgi:Tfp pilus assembly protein PilO